MKYDLDYLLAKFIVSVERTDNIWIIYGWHLNLLYCMYKYDLYYRKGQIIISITYCKEKGAPND